MDVLNKHVYEYKKGVRDLFLYTTNSGNRSAVEERLERLVKEGLEVEYKIYNVGRNNINVFFGKPACIKVVDLLVPKGLNNLSDEEDFMLGALLGYDLEDQCERYLKRKGINLDDVLEE